MLQVIRHPEIHTKLFKRKLKSEKIRIRLTSFRSDGQGAMSNVISGLVNNASLMPGLCRYERILKDDITKRNLSSPEGSVIDEDSQANAEQRTNDKETSDIYTEATEANEEHTDEGGM